MNITRIGSQPSAKGREDWFTGAVRIDPLFQGRRSRRWLGRERSTPPSESSWTNTAASEPSLASCNLGRAGYAGTPVQLVEDPCLSQGISIAGFERERTDCVSIAGSPKRATCGRSTSIRG